MKHVIITRMGLARKDDAFYREHLKLCRMTLARSLEAQSDKAFIWAVAIDERAPSWVESAVQNLCPSVDTEVWRRDPFIHGLNPVDKERLKEIANGGNIVTTRVDDDDMLHQTFVERTRAELRGTSLATFLTYPLGYYMSASATVRMSKPWIGLGLSCLSTSQIEAHAYRFSHSRTGDMARNAGYAVRVVESDEPMWIRTIRSTSDSIEANRKRSKLKGDHVSVRLSDFGLSPITKWRLTREMRAHDASPERPGITQEKPLPRLHMKLQILRRIKALREEEPLPKDEIEALATALYSF